MVTAVPALCPIAVLELAEVFASKAKAPIATLFAPVVLATIELLPTAVL